MSNRRWSLGLMAGLLLWSAGAQAWWNDDWTLRKPLQIDTSPSGANVGQAIGTTPILVRLHAGNFRFDLAKEDGSDLRFVAADDKTLLAHHLELFDPLLGEALVWVSLPDLKPGVKTSFWLYSHNPKAVAAEDVKGTFDKSTLLAWHFAERGQPSRDSSSFGNHAAAVGAGADGTLIGRGLRLDGTAGVIVPASPSLAWAAGATLTWSAWIKLARVDGNAVVFARRDGASALLVTVDEGKPTVEIQGEGGPRRAASTAILNAGVWHHVAFTAGTAIVLYVDGVEAARAAGGVPTLATAAVIGADAGRNDLPPSAPAQKDDVTAGKLSGFKGELDELQISNVERPAGWLQLVAIIQGTDPSRALSAGQDEESGAGGGTFTILMKSVTLDGWIVIGLLGIMALVSISVMVRKVLTLNEAQAANRRFTKQYRQASVDFAKLVEATTGLSPLGDEGRLRSSPLYKLLRICVEETRKRTGRGHALSAQAIESIRAGLDAELVRQGQELNSQMVLLTIAISGGPFLGLLGTVVGVMIVFASIAAAGDVNVNAIAPGIAAALVATVAGLAVAIPSLFGYNWLLIQIRSLLATHHVFVDELVTRLAEEHAEPSIRKLALAVAPAAGQ